MNRRSVILLLLVGVHVFALTVALSIVSVFTNVDVTTELFNCNGKAQLAVVGDYPPLPLTFIFCVEFWKLYPSIPNHLVYPGWFEFLPFAFYTAACVLLACRYLNGKLMYAYTGCHLGLVVFYVAMAFYLHRPFREEWMPYQELPFGTEFSVAMGIFSSLALSFGILIFETVRAIRRGGEGEKTDIMTAAD